MNISFDFDGVLDTEKGLEFLDSFLDANRLSNMMGIPFRIHIVTTRHEDANNEEILRITQQWGIHSRNIHFTNGKWKWETLEELKIDFHVDDNPDEVHLINEKMLGMPWIDSRS